VLFSKCSPGYVGTGPHERCGLPPTNSEFLVGPSSIFELRICMTNKPALLVFYGLIIASVTVWVPPAVTML
jgi:hypothetical protein